MRITLPPRATVWLMVAMFVAGVARAAEPLPVELEGVDVQEKLGNTIPGDVSFLDQDGHPVKMSDYLHRGRPVILNLAYYSCPMLCSMVTNGFVEGMKQLDMTVGEDFDIVTVSIDPNEKPDLARQKRENYLASLGQPEAGKGWAFLTGKEEDIRRLADSVGFRYRYDERQGQYAHAAVLTFLSETGKVSRYLYGFQFPPLELRLSVVEASQGKIGSPVDHLLLFCYHYDPVAKKYQLMAWNVMRLGGVITMLGLGALLFPTWLSGLRRRGLPVTAAEGRHG